MARPKAQVENDDFDADPDAAADAAEETSDDKRSPEEKFTAAANRRFKVWVVRTRAIAKLHSKTYGYSTDQAEKLLTAMQSEFDNMATLLRTRPERDDAATPDLF